MRRIALLTASLLTLCSGGFASNLVINGSFELPVLGSQSLAYGSGSTAINGWTVTGATCGGNCVTQIRSDYIEGPLTFLPEDGTYELDLTGNGNTLDGGVVQTLATVPGTGYTLTFWVGNQDNSAPNYPLASTLAVFLNNVSQGLFSNGDSTPNALNWAQFSLTFTGTGSDAIEFRNATALADNMLGLDNVVVTETAATPEPGPFFLMGAGGIALGLLRRRISR